MIYRFIAVTWDFNPTLVSLGFFDVRWYGLMWALGFAVSMWLFTDFVRREGYPPKVFDSIFWYAVLSTVIGARLGHCLFYQPMEYLKNPIEILKIWEGGLASHGAALGLLLGLWMFSRKNKMPYLWSLDRIMIAVAIAGCLVRLGNLFNSEIYGTATGLPWGFRFITNMDAHWHKGAEAIYTQPCHPTQIYEALCYLIIFFVLLWLYYKRDMARRRPGLLFGIGVFAIFAARFVIEFVKTPQAEFEQGMALDMGQILSIPFVVLGLWFIIRAYARPAITPPPLKPYIEPQQRGKDKKKKK